MITLTKFIHRKSVNHFQDDTLKETKRGDKRWLTPGLFNGWRHSRP
jgi:hypothetical protein